jgi:hypothetical protein
MTVITSNRALLAYVLSEFAPIEELPKSFSDSVFVVENYTKTAALDILN